MVIQMGARRNYIYARQLEQAGLLHSLVTDLAWCEHSQGAGRRALTHLAPRLAGAVRRRTVSGIPPEKLVSTPLPHFTRAMLWRRQNEDRFVAADEILGLACRLRGLGGARVVVNYLGNGGSFLDYAKVRGAKVVTDFVCMPSVWEIEEQERRRWPAWGGTPIAQPVIDKFRIRMRRLLALSDLYLCPSNAVAADLANLPEFDPRRVRITPYGPGGVSTSALRPEVGRVLFAGAGLPRKGLPYFGLAAARLAQEGFAGKFVVAGQVTSIVRLQPETQRLEFLGVLDKAGMTEQLSRADVFCLPSLTEGSSSAIFEALAFGIPVVTTTSSGSVVQDGVEGLIVPERSGEAIATAVQTIVTDRALRHRMSQAALATAARYSDEACGAAFVDVIREIQGL